jgi:AMP nucleosidase
MTDDESQGLADVDGAALAGARLAGVATALCDVVEKVEAQGRYPCVVVTRPWSRHNPQLRGELAGTRAIRWYLERELAALLGLGARIRVEEGRPAVALDDPRLYDAVDEARWDLQAKKLFLFGPERVSLSLDRLSHYTGTDPEGFQRYVLFTNYDLHLHAFRERFPDAIGPRRKGVQMAAWHQHTDRRDGVSIVNIGIGPSNAKTITDHVGVLRPDAMVMIGHCGGLRNHQDLGDFVLANAYLRRDHVLDEALPVDIPVAPNHHLNRFLLATLEERGVPFRVGTVFTTDNRNWEFERGPAQAAMRLSRSLAVDMESATVAANGFRYRVPNATLLCVSDKPLHGAPKLAGPAARFYEASRRQHLDLALAAIDRVRTMFPQGIPNADIRSPDEPLLGTGPGGPPAGVRPAGRSTF